jgi:hypothetical protein
MNRLHLLPLAGTVLATAALVAACGGGGGDSPSSTMSTSNGTGTLSLSLTDAPSCGYDSAFVTVEKVRVHQSSSAGDGDAGWSEVVLNPPQRVDLLTLTNGTLMPLGQTELPAGTYTQMRLVLGSAAPPGWPSATLANAIKPSGGDKEIELTTPSGQQSGLKMNVDITVPAGQVADFAIDFDACKSFVKAGNSGKYLLKPVLSVIPILEDPGQRIVGFVDPSLANTGTIVSAQFAGVPVRATPPNSTTGRFVLYPVPAGTYDLVITASGRVNAVMTGVPVADAVPTLVGSDAARIDTPLSTDSYLASGTISVSGSTANTGAAVRATQTLSGGPTIEVGYGAADALTGNYGMTLPAGAPVKLPYVAGATTFAFAGNPLDAGKYRLEASAPGFAAKTADIDLTTAVGTAFAFP